MLFLDHRLWSEHQRGSHRIESEAGPSQEPSVEAQRIEEQLSYPVERERQNRKRKYDGGTIPNPKKIS